jgi:hypothetical protein
MLLNVFFSAVRFIGEFVSSRGAHIRYKCELSTDFDCQYCCGSGCILHRLQSLCTALVFSW